jgi:hypothetical protein
MSFNIIPAIESDAPTIEKLTALSFEKFNLKDKGLNYDKKSTLNRIITFIRSPEFRVIICVNQKRFIKGFVIAAVCPTLYDDSTKQIVELGMQADPNLNNVTQSKILLKLIAEIENIAEQEELAVKGISICPEFDISSHLEKRGYKLSDKIYIKGREL